MAVLFHEKTTKYSPEVFSGVQFQSLMHPVEDFFDGWDVKKYGHTNMRCSFGIFTFYPGAIWPKTEFRIDELVYCIEGRAIFEVDNKEYILTPGALLYIPKGEVRIIQNKSNEVFRYLSLVDPAWLPEYEELV